MIVTPYVDASGAQGDGKAQVRRPAGLLLQVDRGAGSLAGDRPPGG